jgi:hypothetical protein
MRKIFHLEIKSDSSHKYYGSLSALCSENPNLGVSKFTLDRFDFTEPFENGICIIRKSVMKTTGSVGEKKVKIYLFYSFFSFYFALILVLILFNR